MIKTLDMALQRPLSFIMRIMDQNKTGTTNVSPMQTQENKKSIMLLDDDPVQLQYLADILQGDGFQIMAYSDAQEALSSIGQRTKIDLVITDLQIPRMDGMQFVEKLRKVRPGMPIIMLTAHASVDTFFKSFGLGVSEFITKPINKAELRKIVSVVINKDG